MKPRGEVNSVVLQFRNLEGSRLKVSDVKDNRISGGWLIKNEQYDQPVFVVLQILLYLVLKPNSNSSYTTHVTKTGT